MMLDELARRGFVAGFECKQRRRRAAGRWLTGLEAVETGFERIGDLHPPIMPRDREPGAEQRAHGFGPEQDHLRPVGPLDQEVGDLAEGEVAHDVEEVDIHERGIKSDPLALAQEQPRRRRIERAPRRMDAMGERPPRRLDVLVRPQERGDPAVEVARVIRECEIAEQHAHAPGWERDGVARDGRDRKPVDGLDRNAFALGRTRLILIGEMEDGDGLGDVAQAREAAGGETKRGRPPHLAIDFVRDADAARLGECDEARRDVDGVAEDVGPDAFRPRPY